MDGKAAIDDNHQALKRIVNGLVGMAGLGCLSSPLAGEDGSARQGKAEPLAETGEGASSRPLDAHAAGMTLPASLPRHLRLAILRLLRPAEAAARRLIIAAARGLSVVLPPPRKKPARVSMVPHALLRRFGIAVVISPADCAPARRPATTRADRPLPLIDPPQRPFRRRHRIAPAHAAPRVLFPGITEPHSLPPPPSPDDPIDAANLARRLAALSAALDDLPGQARRFARWQALQARNRDTGTSPRPFRRNSPLRPGRPPGGRLFSYDPASASRRNIRDVDEILAHAHALALYALAHPDTS